MLEYKLGDFALGLIILPIITIITVKMIGWYTATSASSISAKEKESLMT